MYQKFWNQFLSEAADSKATFNLDTISLSPTLPDNIPRGPTGIKAHLSGSGLYLDDYLGGGADGKVYRVIDEKSGKRYALKVVSPSTRRSNISGQSAQREVQNYKFLKDNRDSFGEKGKYFPIVYKAEYTEIPMPNEPADGQKEPAGLILMEELKPLPDDLLKKLFAMSGAVKGQALNQRDKILFKNNTIVGNFLKKILDKSRIYPQNDKKTKKIIQDTIKKYNNFSLSPSQIALLATEKETKRNMSNYGRRLMASLLDSLVINDMQSYENPKSYVTLVSQSIGSPFLYNYKRPLKTTDSYAAEGSVFVGFDEMFDKEGYIDEKFPEATTLKDQIKAFEDLGIGFKDVHSGNVMMRPKTNDIVIVDLGRFNI